MLQGVQVLLVRDDQPSCFEMAKVEPQHDSKCRRLQERHLRYWYNATMPTAIKCRAPRYDAQ